MALFPERRTDGRTLLLDNCSFIGDCLGRSYISNELLHYIQWAAREGTVSDRTPGTGERVRYGNVGEVQQHKDTYGMPWRPQGPPDGEMRRRGRIDTEGGSEEKEGCEEASLRNPGVGDMERIIMTGSVVMVESSSSSGGGQSGSRASPVLCDLAGLASRQKDIGSSRALQKPAQVQSNNRAACNFFSWA